MSRVRELEREVESNDPKRSVRPALGTAGLTQAFSGYDPAGLWESDFPKLKTSRPGSPAGFRYFNPNPKTRNRFLGIRISVEAGYRS